MVCLFFKTGRIEPTYLNVFTNKGRTGRVVWKETRRIYYYVLCLIETPLTTTKSVWYSMAPLRWVPTVYMNTRRAPIVHVSLVIFDISRTQTIIDVVCLCILPYWKPYWIAWISIPLWLYSFAHKDRLLSTNYVTDFKQIYLRVCLTINEDYAAREMWTDAVFYLVSNYETVENDNMKIINFL